MKIQPTSYALLAALAIAGSACDNHVLVGNNNPDGSTTGTAGVTGTGSAGTTSTGAGGSVTGTGTDGGTSTGAAGAPVPGTGSGGGTGTVTRVVKPLVISGQEAITRITAVIWNDKPDADLMQQAAQGHFTTTSDLYGAIRQVLADPKAATGVGAFYRWWLDLPLVATLVKDPTLYPAFTTALQADMASETETFGVKVTLDLNGSYGMLMTAPMSFINARLAALYGVANIQGDALTQVNLDPKERAGLLTQPALLALWSDPARTDPSRRGTRVLEKIFCRPIPPPPANIPPAAALTPGMTQRQATEAISTTLAACAACHNLMDPPGLVYENFDAIGRWRTTDNGQPVDVSGLSIGIASGLNVSIADAPVVVNGPIELANVAAQAASSQQCMAQQWLMYALKLMYTLNTSTQIDALVADVYPIFKSSGFNLKELIVSVLTTDAFLAP
jgi:cytochrome c553